MAGLERVSAGKRRGKEYDKPLPLHSPALLPGSTQGWQGRVTVTAMS